MIDSQGGERHSLASRERWRLAPYAQGDRDGKGEREWAPRAPRVPQFLDVDVFGTVRRGRTGCLVGKMTMHNRRMMPVSRIVCVLGGQQTATRQEEKGGKSGRSKEGPRQPGDYDGHPGR